MRRASLRLHRPPNYANPSHSITRRASFTRSKAHRLERLRKGILGFLSGSFLAFTGGVAITGCPPDRQKITHITEGHFSNRNFIPRVETFVHQTTTFDQPVIAHGILRPKKPLVINFEVDGTVIFVHDRLKPGNFIKKGELLYEIDSPHAKTALAMARSKVGVYEAQIEGLISRLANHQERMNIQEQQVAIAQKNWQIERDLLAENSSTRQRVDHFYGDYLHQRGELNALAAQAYPWSADLISTRGLLEAAQETLKSLQAQLDRTQYYCPFDAQVVQVHAAATEHSVAGRSLAVLADSNAFNLTVFVSPQELRWTDIQTHLNPSSVHSPIRVKVKWESGRKGETFEGVVLNFDSYSSARQAQIHMEVENSPTRPLKFGANVEVEIPTRVIQSAVVIPQNALFGPNEVIVFQPDRISPMDGSLSKVKVGVARKVGGYLLIEPSEDGLKPGDKIVLNPPQNFVQGMKAVKNPSRLASLSP